MKARGSVIAFNWIGARPVCRRTAAAHAAGAGVLALLGATTWLIAAAPPDVSKLPPAANTKVDFVHDIKPIFERSCVKCHGPEKQKGGLRLDLRDVALEGGENYAPDIVPGKSASSPLIHFVAGLVEEMVMPAEGERLTPAQVGLLRAWIDQGAIWPVTSNVVAQAEHWAFKPPVPSPLPATKNPRWVRNPIDAFILARLEQAKLSPSPETDRRTLIRRLSLDVTGLPPDIEAVEQFVKDRSRDACEKLVDRLLASPHYGERWARHWLDVVRFAETHGFETNTPRENAWPFRDYVIRAFNEDKPYNQLILEQLAGDAFGVEEATGFIVAGPWDAVKSPDIVLTSNQRADELHDMVATTGSAFLGLTVGCARCHNHKFDPISQAEYYAIKACFAGVQHGERKLRAPGDEERLKEAEVLRKRVTVIDNELSQFDPIAFTGRTILLDDETPATSPRAATVTALVKPKTTAKHAAGKGRGELDDTGDATRWPNLGRSYTAWSDVAGQNVFSYEPHAAGKFHVWLSWGCGFNTHAADTRYILDLDGDLGTTADQTEIAKVDQRHFADGGGDLPGKALWSGLYDAGVWDVNERSRILLRAGATDAYVTADLIVLQEVTDGSAGRASQPPFLRAAVHPRQNLERFAPVAARLVRFTILETTGIEPCLDELEVYTAEASPRNAALASAGTKATASGTYPDSPLHKLEHINDGQIGNSHSWISSEIGKGWVQLEFPSNLVIDKIVWGRDREEKYADRLATNYKIETATQPGEWRLIAGSADRFPYVPGQRFKPSAITPGLSEADAARSRKLLDEREAHEAKIKELTAAAMVYAGKFTEPEPTYRFHRGDPMQKREVIPPGAIASFPVQLQLAGNAPEQERRLALARWISDPQNPLTARVMVNRIWQYHFGEGIVNTPSDFGRNGARPTHPELLDWLATEFMAQGWKPKAIHRLILLSATYRQSSRPNPAGLAVDANNRLLWRFTPRRLEAEPIRDSILWVSGKLDPGIGGPGYNVFEPNDNYVRVYNPKQEFGPAEWRRMIYQYKPRMQQDATFGAFDCPDGGQITPRRTSSTTPLQALNLMNSRFVIQQAGFFAERLATEAGADAAAEVRLAFRLAFGRAPSQAEAAAAVKLVNEQGLKSFCRALLNANEFLFVF